MIRVYLTPFNDLGEFDQEVDITSDVDLSSIGKIERRLDNSEYDIGILKFNNFNLKLQNFHGKYSEVENLRSIFRFRRSGSKIRVTWAPAEFAICGAVVCGETVLSEEVTIYRGILNDEPSVMAAVDQIVDFQVLSIDSLFSKEVVPFADLVIGDTLSEILFKCLNQPSITRYIELDVLNIDLNLDYEVDELEWFENKTVKEAIEKLMLAANSIVFVDDDVVYAVPRIPSLTVEQSFYGQASDLGTENITSINQYRNGQNRIINYVRWKDSTTFFKNSPSIDKWGVFLKELDIQFVTDPIKQLQTATSIVTEFKDPRKEFILETFMDADALERKFLDRVDIDYPPLIDTSAEIYPVVGLTEIGDVSAPLPKLLWDFNLNQVENFKIMGINLDLKKELVSFNLRGAVNE